MNYQTVKNLLLLSALSFCWQSRPLANEREVEVGQGGIKRSAQQAGLFHREEHDCYLKDFPVETTSKIIEFLDPDKDENTLLHLSFCTKSDPWKIQKLIEEKFAETNKKEHAYQWQDKPLTERNLYIFNKRIRIILGLYNNISGNANMAGDIDRIMFERLCSQFLKETPLFSATFIPVMYVEMLRLDQQNRQGFNHFQLPFTNDLRKLLETKKQSCIYELSNKASQLNPVCQNEATLYFHYCQFVSKLAPMQLTLLQNEPVFRQLNGSLMRVMDPELLSLKATPGLSNAGNFAETWKKIIDLESTATIFQLDAAACSYFNAGKGETKDMLKFNAFSKAAKYREEELNAINAVGRTPTSTNYANTATACYNAGFCSKEFTDFLTKAIEYYEKNLESIQGAGQTPRPDDYSYTANAYFQAGSKETDLSFKTANFIKAAEYYGNAADAYLRAALSAADLNIRTANFIKAAEYYGEKLNSIENAGQIPTPDDYHNTAYAYLQAGLSAADLITKTTNFTKAAEYYGNAANACFKAGWNTTVYDNKTKTNFTKAAEYYGKAAEAYLQACCNTTDQYLKTANFIKAAEYYRRKLDSIKNAGQLLTPNDYYNTAEAYLQAASSTADVRTKTSNYALAAEYYGNAANAYIQAGLGAADLSTKTASFIKATEHYERKLEITKEAGLNSTLNDYDNTANAYLQAGLSTADLSIKTINSTKAAEYCGYAAQKAFLIAHLEMRDFDIRTTKFIKATKYWEKKLEILKGVGQTATPVDYYNAAEACFHAGWDTTNLNIKTTNFTKALAYFESSLEMGLTEEMTQQAQTYLRDISDHLNETGSNKTVEEQLRDG